MIDVDKELAFQPAEPGALNTVTLQHDGSFEVPVDRRRLDHVACQRQRLVNDRHRIVQHHLRLLAQLAQHLGAGQQRADGVTIRPGMRGHHELLALANGLQYAIEHERTARKTLPGAFYRALQQLVNSSAVLL